MIEILVFSEDISVMHTRNSELTDYMNQIELLLDPNIFDKYKKE